MVLSEHFHTCRGEELVGQPKRCIAREENRGGSFHGLFVDLSNPDNVEFKLSERASDNLAESVSPDERLHSKGKHYTVSRLIKVIGGKHDHHNNARTVSPEVDDHLIETTILPVSNAASLENKVANGSELGAFLDTEDDRCLHDSYLQSLCVVD